MEKKYWSSVEVLNGETPKAQEIDNSDERSLLEIIDEEITAKPSSRRNFLKFCGFSFAGAAIASSCENPVKKAIPYLNKPEEVTPGMANHYASTYFDGFEYNAIIVKVRDGRPIKIEGNQFSSISRGRTTARVQASLLSLYDGIARLKNPVKDGAETNWAQADNDIVARLRNVAEAGQQTVILTSNVISPSTRTLINDFLLIFPGKHVVYEPVSYTGMLLANKVNLDINGIPDYLFDKASIIVSFSADFLGTWLSPAEYAFRYGIAKDLQNGRTEMVKHYQFESGLSITGSKADERYPIKPSEEPGVILQLYNEIAKLAGQTTVTSGIKHPAIEKIAATLWSLRGKSIVVSGSNDPDVQMVINAINALLDNYGNTLDLNRLLLTNQAIDSDMNLLVEEMKNGTVGGLIMWNCNPAFDYHQPEDFIEGLKNMKVTVSMNGTVNETNEHFRYVLPAHHYLESWDDAEPKTGVYSLAQPVIRNIFNTRQPQDSLLKWMGSTTDYYQYIKTNWLYRSVIIPESEWNATLQKGVYEIETPVRNYSFNGTLLNDSLAAIAAKVKQSANNIEVQAYTGIALGNGIHANNPWLLELPDPITKVSWDNIASISAATAQKLNLITGSLILINGLKFPVYIQPGQADDTISVALGYGHIKYGKVATGIGSNAYKLVTYDNNSRCRNKITGVEIKPLAGEYPLAISQKHGSLEERPIVRETILSRYKENPEAGNELHAEFEKKHVTLYKENQFPGHHWAMGVDLNKCVGCSTCVIACQAENNIPVVGKEEVQRTRIMHWMRIDRYYSGDLQNPEVVFQPLACQHCDNAPCENVCPVSATNHSSEGLNQMAYNRCIGTKYCINNCPYKVRRFNWFRYATNEKFDYNMNSDLGRMVLNPDVTVRERGVVEKCTFCVQRIQEKKLQAKLENRPLADGDILPACVQSCPADALVFGDLNDPESKISRFYKDPRNYHLLEELHTLPSVGYLTMVRNKEEHNS